MKYSDEVMEHLADPRVQAEALKHLEKAVENWKDPRGESVCVDVDAVASVLDQIATLRSRVAELEVDCQFYESEGDRIRDVLSLLDQPARLRLIAVLEDWSKMRPVVEEAARFVARNDDACPQLADAVDAYLAAGNKSNSCLEGPLTEGQVERLRGFDGYRRMREAGHSDLDIIEAMEAPGWAYVAGSWGREGPW